MVSRSSPLYYVKCLCALIDSALCYQTLTTFGRRVLLAENSDRSAIMSTEMAVDIPKPPKLVLDEFIGTALSATPSELHPFFDSFRSLHTRKYVFF